MMGEFCGGLWLGRLSQDLFSPRVGGELYLYSLAADPNVSSARLTDKRTRDPIVGLAKLQIMSGCVLSIQGIVPVA